MQVLPSFAVCFYMLSWAEYFATVHTGAVVPSNTVSSVILILAFWAVAATVTNGSVALEINQKESLLA